jgi:hypothetical protein
LDCGETRVGSCTQDGKQHVVLLATMSEGNPFFDKSILLFLNFLGLCCNILESD